ncbi:AraC family transcriptional regulator [Pedobacter sp. PLR]|uniref:helix-turn-helix domain-containing protein n=1 Tax=Pedobacter sp. PLR TaxID=2994465 RepID=UPI00224663A7|nr:AraC family transcriptional regulator [Pedobacter sp. PLR]MCX2452009.1 AraC family transcriptional regulator [Pedobacter sp. PLR]
MKKNNKLFIKGMVCNRCITVLSDELFKLGLDVSSINLGEVILKENNKTPVDEETVKAVLQKHGFELLTDKNEQLISHIKHAVELGINEQSETGDPVRFSKLISDELQRDYDSLSAIFSIAQGNTLEKYIIQKRIEEVKALLVYTDKSLTDIAHTLGYSSVAYLSRQLKKNTGFDFAHYKRIRRDKLAIMKKSKRE